MPLTTDKTVNPIKVTGTTSSDTEVFGEPIRIKFLYWFNPTTKGDLLTLKTKTGRDIIPLRCEADNESQLIPIFPKFHA